MWNLPRLLTLPASVLLLIINTPAPTSTTQLQWPYNLPRHVKYYPEDEVLVKREAEILQKLQVQSAAGVRKMSGDPGEKFFLDYWSFEADKELWKTANASHNFETCFLLHNDHELAPILPRYLPKLNLGHSPFDKRDFQCPTGTSACTLVDRPQSCCSNTSICQIIQNTGLGDVGCCPDGQTCGGTLSGCATGYTSCSSDSGGGCCYPGYACEGVGCVFTATVTVQIFPTTSIPSTSSVSTVTTTIVVHPSNTESTPTTRTTTKTVTSTGTATFTLTSPATCSPGYRSCPASLGGGCCATDLDCAEGSCPSPSTFASISAPARPTSALTITTTTAQSSLTISPVGCPTGFYACSAYYQGGCCQIGRNCDKTSCPATASILVVDSSTLTIIAPTGSGITSATLPALTGTCATGWSTCASSDGGGCCPSGFVCGVSCTATVTGEQGYVVGKEAPNAADRLRGKNGRGAMILVLSLATSIFALFV